MKKCPVCDKTFEDSMRFCQTDGTPLVDTIEETPEDPFKTMVARPEDDFASAIPPPNADPFKTMVAGSQASAESEDLLQLPEEFDPMKTAVVSPEELREQLGASQPPQEDAAGGAPPSPFGNADSAPLELDLGASSNASSSTPPDLPKFSEPSISPPDFGGFSSKSNDASENATEVIPSDSVPKFDPNQAFSEPPKQQSSFGDSPFGKQNDAPIPSPFGDATKPFEQPSTPTPQYKEPEPPTVLGASNPFDQSPFGQPPQPLNPPVNQPANQSTPQSDWSPPPAPVSNWQDQNLGANTPFQPPGATAGQNQTLSIISLVLGIVSICCPIAILTGPGALITGFLAIKNIGSDPNQYGGKGLAIAGMVIGGLFFVLSVIWWILRLLGLAYMSYNF
jgi:hypothetical protein